MGLRTALKLPEGAPVATRTPAKAAATAEAFAPKTTKTSASKPARATDSKPTLASAAQATAPAVKAPLVKMPAGKTPAAKALAAKTPAAKAPVAPTKSTRRTKSSPVGAATSDAPSDETEAVEVDGADIDPTEIDAAEIDAQEIDAVEIHAVIAAVEVASEDGKDDAEASDDDDDDDEKSTGKDEVLPTGALVLSLVDDDDEVPVYSSAITGATADPVKDYLKQIGKVALLNAEQEVDLAKRIEAGLQHVDFITRGGGHCFYRIEFFAADEIKTANPVLGFRPRGCFGFAAHPSNRAGSPVHELGKVIEKFVVGLHRLAPVASDINLGNRARWCKCLCVGIEQMRLPVKDRRKAQPQQIG